MPARVLNMLLGIWLFISAFVWPHTRAQRTNTCILGILCVVIAAIALSVDQFRYLNTALAVWLFISAFVLIGRESGTVWNNALVAIAVFIISLVPSDRLRLRPQTAKTA
jgi:O-antigen ligase